MQLITQKLSDLKQELFMLPSPRGRLSSVFLSQGLPKVTVSTKLDQGQIIFQDDLGFWQEASIPGQPTELLYSSCPTLFRT